MDTQHILHIPAGLILLGAQLGSLRAAWVDGEVRAKAASLFTLATPGPAQLTAARGSGAVSQQTASVFQNSPPQRGDASLGAALLKRALVLG